jgi:hypothetical protein
MKTVWAAWLIGAVIISFAVLEGYAIAKGRLTLSECVWLATKAWPPLPFVVGVIVGGLAAHFWWPICF